MSKDEGIDRRAFLKAAVAIGGVNALSAARTRAESAPTGTDDPDGQPGRQFAWTDYSKSNDDTGLAKTPAHHVQLFLNYVPDGTPTESDRETVEEALQTLERAFEWSDEGLLFTISYSGAYFDRFDESLPEETGLLPPETVIERSDIRRGGSIDAKHVDAHLHLSSDNASAVLGAEQALRGEVDTVNGVDVEASFGGVFEVDERRTGFIGNPHERWDEDVSSEDNPIGEDAPVFFGFKSLFGDSQPSEDHVVIEDGHPFAGGTTEQVSLLRDEGVKNWYAQNDHEERAQRMYSPEHTSDDTGPHGRELGATSGTVDGSEGETMEEIAERTARDAEEKGVVGHAQKLARARDPLPPLLRRDFPSTDRSRPHTQFISNQRTIEDFVNVRRAMSFVDPESDKPAASEVPLKDHGIQGYLSVESRSTYLMPPRELRALPPARP